LGFADERKNSAEICFGECLVYFFVHHHCFELWEIHFIVGGRKLKHLFYFAVAAVAAVGFRNDCSKYFGYSLL